MTDKKTLTKADLARFTGTERYYRHPYNRNVLFTDGVRYVAETGEVHWLVDNIAFLQSDKAVSAEAFQVWKLTLQPDRSATLTCEDGNRNIVHTMDIPFTDFPLDEISFFYTNNVLTLPSEH